MPNKLTKKLTQKKCLPCEGGVKRFSSKEAKLYVKGLSGWRLAKNKKSIFSQYSFKNFMAVIQFIGKIAKLAEKEGHHPDFHLTRYRNLRIELSTHAIGGLSLNDFILAAKIDRIPKSLKK